MDYLLKDIESLLGTHIDFKEDIRQIRESIINLFKEKYFNKIQSLIEENRIQAQENPTKEMTLLKALKPFMDSKNHQMLDEIEKFINTIRVLENVNQKLKSLHRQSNDDDSKEEKKEKIIVDQDGVYEIDEACINNIQRESKGKEILLLFLIILLLKR